MLEMKILIADTKNIEMCEKIRCDALEIEMPEGMLLDNYYARQLYKSKILPFAAFVDYHMAAGCYVTDIFDSIHIEYLFVQRKYQEKGLHLGRNLLKYVLANQDLIEEYFSFQTNKTTLYYIDDKSKKIYETLGYIETNSETHAMQKILIRG